MAVASPCCCLSRRPTGCRVALPCPRVALLAAAPPYPACASPCPARAKPPCCPHRPTARSLLLAPHGCCPPCYAQPCWPAPCCPHAALLAAAPLPAPPCPRRPATARPAARRRAGRRPAAHTPPCWQLHRPTLPIAALLATALPCVGRVPLFPSRAPPLPALRASLVLERRPACVLPYQSRATLLYPLWLLSVFSPLIMRAVRSSSICG
ncbi:unnamed protein product [Closterium sp. NIES-54]